MTRLLALAASLIFAVWMTGCAAVQTAALLAQPPAGLPVAAELSEVPFFAQTAYQCGPAALATSLGAVGINASPEALAEQVFLPARAGTLQTEMLAGARRQGAVAVLIPGTLEAVLREVAAGHAVVVLQNLGLGFAPMWHYAVVVGYDLNRQQVLLRSGTTQRERMRLRTFEHTWRRSGFWAFVSLAPGQWPATVQEAAALDAALGFERAAPPVQAQQVYASALARWPSNLSLAMGLGNTRFASGDKAGAAETFRAAAQQHRSAPAWINLSASLLELGRPAEAEASAREALAVGGDVWRAQAEAALHQAQRR